MYKFVPNDYAKQMFNLSAREYVGESMTNLLETALGKRNYDSFMIAQDPLSGGKTEGEIHIQANPGERNPREMQFRSIGQIQKLG